MTQHINKIIYDNIQIVLQQVMHITNELLPIMMIHDFMVAKADIFSFRRLSWL